MRGAVRGTRAAGLAGMPVSRGRRHKASRRLGVDEQLIVEFYSR